MKASARLPRLRFAVTVSRRPEKDTVAVGWQEWSKILKIFCHMKTIKEDIVRVYGSIYDCVTLFTWYGHKNLVNTVLTVAMSDLAL
jgi:hypothetical protein